MTIVTFTTDFGFSDGYVGAMKGVVLSLAPDATLVDITHGIAAQDVVGGAIALAQAAPLFPRGTIHVAVVDPGVGGARADVVVAAGGSFFVGPDNGVLSLAAPEPRQIYRIDAAAFRREPVSPTFHGRDVFAPTAGRLAAGAPPSAAGPSLPALVELDPPLVRRVGDRVEGTVTHVDRFGNLLTSLSADVVPPGAQIEITGREGTFRPDAREDVRRRRARRAGGLHRQLRAAGDRVARRFGGGVDRRRARQLGAAAEGAVNRGGLLATLAALAHGLGVRLPLRVAAPSATAAAPQPDRSSSRLHAEGSDYGVPGMERLFNLVSDASSRASRSRTSAVALPKNRLLIRVQRNGNRIEVNDTLYIDVQNAYEVGALRARVKPRAASPSGTRG